MPSNKVTGSIIIEGAYPRVSNSTAFQDLIQSRR